MPQANFKTILVLSSTALLAFLFSISPFTAYAPQLLALISIYFILSCLKKQPFINLSSLIVNLLIFTTNGLNSPVFFLVYFLLFIIAFQNPPSTTLSFSLVLILLLSQSLNSLTSLLPLFSLLLITPLAWFVGHQYLDNLALQNHLAVDETDFFLWFSLKLKPQLSGIIDSASQLLSQPGLAESRQNLLRSIKKTAKAIQKSAQKLAKQVDEQTDENKQ